MNQLVLPGVVPGSFWVIIEAHGVIPAGTRFLVVREWGDGWWLAWRDGAVPKHIGILLKEEHFRRVKG